MYYGLYNNSNKSYLVHPKVGIWFTENKKEAYDMLKACTSYLTSIQLDSMVEHIVVVEVTTQHIKDLYD